MGKNTYHKYFLVLLLLCVSYLESSSDRSTDKEVVQRSFYSENVLTITTILIEPYTMIKKTNSSNHRYGGTSLYEGYIVDLIDYLADIIGFKYRLVPVWDGLYGYRTADGSWSGMIGEIIRGEADIAAGPMLITEQRQKSIDFTHPFLDVEAAIIMHKSLKGIVSKISSVYDLANQRRVKYGTLNRGVFKREFKQSNVTLYQKMWHEMTRFGDDLFTSTNQEGIDRTRISEYAFILPNTIAEYIVHRHPCDLIMVDSFLSKRGYALGVAKSHPILPYLNNALNTLKEQGYIQQLYDKWWIQRSQCHPVHSKRTFSIIYDYSGSSSSMCFRNIKSYLLLIIFIIFIKKNHLS